MLGVSACLDGLDRRVNDVHRIDRLQLELELAGHDTREVEQIVDELRLNRRVALDHFERPRSGPAIEDAAAEHSRPPEHRRQRRT